jgi:hypothetical protein
MQVPVRASSYRGTDQAQATQLQSRSWHGKPSHVRKDRGSLEEAEGVFDDVSA